MQILVINVHLVIPQSLEFKKYIYVFVIIIITKTKIKIVLHVVQLKVNRIKFVIIKIVQIKFGHMEKNVMMVMI